MADLASSVLVTSRRRRGCEPRRETRGREETIEHSMENHCEFHENGFYTLSLCTRAPRITSARICKHPHDGAQPRRAARRSRVSRSDTELPVSGLSSPSIICISGETLATCLPNSERSGPVPGTESATTGTHRGWVMRAAGVGAGVGGEALPLQKTGCLGSPTTPESPRHVRVAPLHAAETSRVIRWSVVVDPRTPPPPPPPRQRPCAQARRQHQASTKR